MQRVKLANWLAAASILGAGALAATPALAVKVGPVEDPIGVVKIGKGQPITIGGYWVMSGPDTALGVDSKRAAEVYFNQVGNKIAGHPIRFVVEDDGCNAEGGQTAGTKLAANQNIVGVLGPACSSAATAAAPILWKQGMVNIGTASSAPRLTTADRGSSFDGSASSSPGRSPPVRRRIACTRATISARLNGFVT